MKSTKVIRLGYLRKELFDLISESNKESAKVWNICKDKLQEAIKEHKPWPTMVSLCRELSGEGAPKFNLHSQSAQQVCRAFATCVATTKKLRKTHPEMRMRYPHKDKEFYPTIWTSQAAKVKNGFLSLPMGRDKRPLNFRVDLPDGGYPCRIVWHDGYELHVCQEAEVKAQVTPSNIVATIDLGEIHQIACVASNGNAILVSGRGIRTVKHQNSKMLAKTDKLMWVCDKGSKRHKKITKSRNKQSERNRRRVKSLRHKGTALAVQFLVDNQVSKVFIGNPDGVRRKRTCKEHNQRMSLWEYGKDIQYTKEKDDRVGIETLTGSERGTSSTCPCCGAKRRQTGRRWTCRKCGFKGHRDLVGATNMHLLAFGVPVVCPSKATYLRPGPVSGPRSSSRADTLQSSLVVEVNDKPLVTRQGSERDRTFTASIN